MDLFSPAHRLIHLVGQIDDNKTADLLNKLSNLGSRNRELVLYIRTGGGGIANALAIYNFVRLSGLSFTTIASGDVSSAGIIVWLAGTKRLACKYTTMLVHPVPRQFEKDVLLDEAEVAAQRARVELWEKMCIDIVVNISNGLLTEDRLKRMIAERCVWTVKELAEFNLLTGNIPAELR